MSEHKKRWGIDKSYGDEALERMLPVAQEFRAKYDKLEAINADLLTALRRHEWFGTDWNTWRCASCTAEIQDGEELRHDDLCPTAAAITKTKE